MQMLTVGITREGQTFTDKFWEFQREEAKKWFDDLVKTVKESGKPGAKVFFKQGRKTINTFEN